MSLITQRAQVGVGSMGAGGAGGAEGLLRDTSQFNCVESVEINERIRSSL